MTVKMTVKTVKTVKDHQNLTMLMQHVRHRKRSKAIRREIKQRRPYPHGVTPDELSKAIINSGGNRLTVAKRLGISRHYLELYLSRPDFAPLVLELQQELESVADKTESIVHTAAIDGKVRGNDLDPLDQLNAAKWVLSRLRRDLYGDQSKTVIEGGNKPVQVAVAQFPVEVLDLDLDTRRKILAAVEAREQKLLEAQQGAKAVVAQVLPTPAKPPADGEDE